MKHINLSIKAKIAFITVSIIIFAVGSSIFMGSRILLGGYSSALQSETLSIGQSLKFQLDRILKLGLDIGDIIGFEKQCRETVDKYDNVSYAMVMDLDGKILFHNDKTMHGKTVTDTAILEAVKSNRNVIQPYSVQEVKCYDVTIPVLSKYGKHVGAVRIGFPEKIIADKTAHLFAYAVGVSLIAIGLAAVLSIFAFSVWVTNPINKLIAVIQDIRAEGTDLTKRVEVQSQDEIGILAASFNRMIEDLQKTTVSKDYVDNIIQSMIDTLVVATPEGTIQTVNQAVCDLLRYEPEELIGQPIEMIFKEEDDSQKLFHGAGLEELVKSGFIKGIERTYLTKHGGKIPVLFSGSVMSNKVGRIQGIICLASDISERKIAEEKLRKAHDELELRVEERTSELVKANEQLNLEITERKLAEETLRESEMRLRHQQKLEAIGTLAGGVAHEINNPIYGVINYARLISERLDQESPLREFSDGIGYEAERVADIVRNLLAFARQEKESHSPAEIADIVNHTISLIRTIIRRDQIALKVAVPDSLPRIKCRSQQIQQVLMNLLTNARDALNERYPEHDPDKIIAVTVEPFERDGRHWLRTTVEDHGTGIPDEIRERVFDPFYTTKDRIRGTGLGLSISQGIVSDHNGELSFACERDQYTRFYLDLPVDNGWSLGVASDE